MMASDLFIAEYEKVNSAWRILDDAKRKVWGLLSLARLNVVMNEIMQRSPLSNKRLFEQILAMCKRHILQQLPIEQHEVERYHEDLRALYRWCSEEDEKGINETFIRAASGVTKYQIKYVICGIGLFLKYLIDPSMGVRIGSTPTMAVLDDYFRDQYHIDYFTGSLEGIVEIEEEYKRIWADYRFVNEHYTLDALKERVAAYETVNICCI